MATLTQISLTSRRVIRYGIYAIILIVIARYSIQLGVSIYRKIFPPPPPKPTIAFGKLPKMPFPEREARTFNFTLELPEGTLPKFTDQLIIYSMPQFQTNIKALDTAKERARALGFDSNGKPLVESIPNVYIFDRKGFPSRLTMNIITGLFSVSYNLNEDPTVLNGTPPAPENGVTQIQSFLSTASLLTEDLKASPTTQTLLRVEGGKFVPAVSLSDANLIKINIFRKQYGKDSNIPAVTPDMPESNIWFIISGGRGKQIIAGEYHYFPIDNTKSATYPIKTADLAWEELKAGKTFIANAGNNPEGNIVIRRVYLGYYDPGQYSEFYQPVVVFEGDNEFYAYVPAVTDDYYGKEE